MTQRSFHEELAQELLKRYHGDLSSLVVMFPSLRARAFFNDAIASSVDHPVWQPSWMSIDEAMERVSGLRRGERIRLISELFVIYHKHHPKEKFDKFYFWGDMLINDFDMIDRYLIDAKQLLRNIEDIKELEECHVGDYVAVYYEALGIKADNVEIVSTTYDALAERYITVELSTIRTTLAQTIIDYIGRAQ